MSVFVQQNGIICSFNSSTPWSILSPIEQSIKHKIEAVGTPLKDWNIQINYGIKTGYNDAFIIDTSKRDEILASCQTKEERERTAELIRPILRGRDIKRYGYEWANLWLINTHNGIKGKLPRIQIEDYPAIKAHIDQYWNKISERVDKGDTPYNLRNCTYLEDFSKPKILFQEIVQSSQFILDENNHFFCNDTGRIITGESLYFLLAILNSKLFFYSVKKFYGGGVLGEHGIRMKHPFFENFPCIPFSSKIESIAIQLSSCYDNTLSNRLDALIEKEYGLSKEEIQTIRSEFNQSE